MLLGRPRRSGAEPVSGARAAHAAVAAELGAWCMMHADLHLVIFVGRATALNFVVWSLMLNRVGALRAMMRLHRARA